MVVLACCFWMAGVGEVKNSNRRNKKGKLTNMVAFCSEMSTAKKQKNNINTLVHS